MGVLASGLYILVRRVGIPLLNLYWGHVTIQVTRLAFVSLFNNCIKKRLICFPLLPPCPIHLFYYVIKCCAVSTLAFTRPNFVFNSLHLIFNEGDIYPSNHSHISPNVLFPYFPRKKGQAGTPICFNLKSLKENRDAKFYEHKHAKKIKQETLKK